MKRSFYKNVKNDKRTKKRSKKKQRLYKEKEQGNKEQKKFLGNTRKNYNI